MTAPVTQASTLKAPSPVKSGLYQKHLAPARTISTEAAYQFFCQWYAFSASMPAVLVMCFSRTPHERERANILANLQSELGLDGGGEEHPRLLACLIRDLCGKWPMEHEVTSETRRFIDAIRLAVMRESPAFNAGLMCALEQVAYDILDVLKEIISKAGPGKLVRHPYIAIHERLEQEHIDNTEDCIAMHGATAADVGRGYDYMMSRWETFWSSAYTSLGEALWRS